MVSAAPYCECMSCGYLQRLPEIGERFALQCARCHHVLRRRRPNPLVCPLACALAGLALFVVVILLQFMGISVLGLSTDTSLVSFPETLTDTGFWGLSILFLLFVLILPPLKLAILTLVLLGLRLRRPPSILRVVFRCYVIVGPWAMVEVFLAGFFVAYSRLIGLAEVELGDAAWALGGLMLAIVAADATVDPEAIWQILDQRCPRRVRARAIHVSRTRTRPLSGCQHCGWVDAFDPHGHSHCPRCNGRVWPRKPASLSRTWALLIAACICAIGAYTYPVMTVTRLGQGQPTSIIDGIVELFAIGWWPIGIIVFIASLTIPLFKLVALATMLVKVHRGGTRRLHGLTVIYRFVEAVGRWSMIDIFMVSILTVVVQLGVLGEVHPNRGAIAFAAVVILTMLAAYSFDPRLMWDRAVQTDHE
jgi:paraquat-inducible protein A